MRHYVNSKTYLRHREALESWVVDHGLDLNVVPIPSTFEISGEEVEVECYVRDEAGKLLRDEDAPALLMVKVPLRRPWPLPTETTAAQRPAEGGNPTAL